jgi:hypothetical protein
MTHLAAEGACAFAWRNYLLHHSGISENDRRRRAADQALAKCLELHRAQPDHSALGQSRAKKERTDGRQDH